MVKPACAVILCALAAASLAPRAQAAAAAELSTPPFPAAADEGSAMVWLKNNTNLGVGRFVAFSPDNVLVVLTDEVSTRSPSVHKISFRQEAVRIDFVSRTGGRSLRGSGDIDCATGSFRAEKVELFSGTDLRGDRVASEGPDATGRVPRSGSAPAVAAAQVCGGADAALAPLLSTARRTPAPAPAPPPAPVPAAKPTAASTAVAVAEPTPLPPPPRRAPVAEATPLAPAGPRREPAPTPAPAPPPAPPPATPAPPPAAPAAAPPAGEFFAQIGAFGSREAAERAWSHLAELFPDLVAGKTMRIDTVAVNGAPVYRSAIAGLASQAEALALCARLMASSEACFVRKGP